MMAGEQEISKRERCGADDTFIHISALYSCRAPPRADSRLRRDGRKVSVFWSMHRTRAISNDIITSLTLTLTYGPSRGILKPMACGVVGGWGAWGVRGGIKRSI